MNIVTALTIIHAFLFCITLLVVYQKARPLLTWVPYAALVPFIPVVHAIICRTDVNRLAMRRIQGGYMACLRCRGVICHPNCPNAPRVRSGHAMGRRRTDKLNADYLPNEGQHTHGPKGHASGSPNRGDLLGQH